LSVLGALRRVRQFTLALGAQFAGDGSPDLEACLGQPQLEIYRRMSSMDQRHCLATCRALRDGGYSDASLLTAAILHDAGKTLGPVRIWHRVGAVLARALAPSLWERAGGKPGSLLYPWYVYREHAALGAALAREAGCSSEVVWLIAHHEDHTPPVDGDQQMNRLLAALQAADRVN
jgi:hypothetical protein